MSAVVATALLLTGSGLAGPKIYPPKVGSRERQAIMDALRRVIVPKVKQTVIFKVAWIRSTGTTAFLTGQPLRPDGKPLDYSRTIYAQAIKEGAFDDGFSALLRKKKGRWIADEWQIGATDIPWDGMWSRKNLPRALFPGPT